MGNNTKNTIKDMVRKQIEYLDRKVRLEHAIKEYKVREQEKFANVTLIDLLHTPK